MGFLTLGRRFLNQVPDIIDDRLDVICRGTMALTIGCARCHDHKFDPIPTKDYYSLYGVLDSSTEPKDLPLLVRFRSDPGLPRLREGIEGTGGRGRGITDTIMPRRFSARRGKPEMIAEYLIASLNARAHEGGESQG